MSTKKINNRDLIHVEQPSMLKGIIKTTRC